MLKIKDDVRLEKLIEIGFKYDTEVEEYYYTISRSEILVIDEQEWQIRLFVDDEYYECYTEENSFDMIYDLIQAGLVEKI